MALCLCIGALPAHAKVYIDLAAPSIKRLPIAIQEFRFIGPDPFSDEERKNIRDTAETILKTLKQDMNFSGVFKVLDNDAFLEEPEEAGFGLQRINR